MISKLNLLTFFILISNALFAQETSIGVTLSNPENAHYGTTETQMKAMPHLDEARMMINKGNTIEAIKELLEAIEISHDLVEAHLLLGDLYSQTKEYGLAFKYYNKGIDFHIRQDRIWFQKLFNLDMQLGEYEIVWQNASHYKKVHKAAEIDYILNSKVLVSHYKSWYGNYSIQNTAIALPVAGITKYKNGYIATDTSGSILKVKMKNGSIQKMKKVSVLPSVRDIHGTSSGLVYFSQIQDGNWKIMQGEFNGKTLSNSKFLEIQTDFSCRYPFFHEKSGQLFFSQFINGQWDIYFCRLNNGIWTNPVPADKINTPQDEISPGFYNNSDIFYFSSNGQPGFGGFDIFYCEDNEQVNGVFFPLNPKNMLYPLNSNLNETGLIFTSQNQGLVIKHDLWNQFSLFTFDAAKLHHWQGEKYVPVKERW